MKVLKYTLVVMTNLVIFALLAGACAGIAFFANLGVTNTYAYDWPLAFGVVCGVFIWIRFIPKEIRSFDASLTHVTWYFNFWVVNMSTLIVLLWLNSLGEFGMVNTREMVGYNLLVIIGMLIVRKLVDQLGNAHEPHKAS